MCQQNKVKRYELIELIVPSGATKVTFPTVPQLRNQANQIILIQGVEIFSDGAYTKSQFDSTIAGIPYSVIETAVLVLYVNGEESIKMIPLAKLLNLNTNSASEQNATFPMAFDDLTNVDFDKSYVQFNTALVSSYVIPFGISYIRLMRNPGGDFGQ